MTARFACAVLPEPVPAPAFSAAFLLPLGTLDAVLLREAYHFRTAVDFSGGLPYVFTISGFLYMFVIITIMICRNNKRTPGRLLRPGVRFSPGGFC